MTTAGPSCAADNSAEVFFRLISGVEAALAYGGQTHTAGDVVRAILAGEAQLWANDDDALIVSEIHDHPRARVLHFWLAAGDLEPVIALSRRVLEWGRSVGCTRATLAGRKGWVRALASEGWAPELVVMGRDIGGGR